MRHAPASPDGGSMRESGGREEAGSRGARVGEGCAWDVKEEGGGGGGGRGEGGRETVGGGKEWTWVTDKGEFSGVHGICQEWREFLSFAYQAGGD